MQQLRERYASRICYYARASLWRQRQGLNYAQSQPTVSSTDFNFYWLDEVNRSVNIFIASIDFKYGINIDMHFVK